MRVPLTIATLALAVACSHHEPVPPPIPAIDAGGATTVSTTTTDAGSLSDTIDAIAPKVGIGFEGGTVEGDNAKMIVPETALSAPVALSIKRVPDSELSSWPRGTALG